MPQTPRDSDFFTNASSPQDRPPSERATKTRLVGLVVIVLAVAAMIMWNSHRSHDAVAIDAVEAALVNDLKAKRENAESKAIEMSKGRAFDFASASSPEELTRRIGLVERAQQANDDLLVFGDQAADRLSSDLRAKNVPAGKIDDEVKLYQNRVWGTQKRVTEESGRMYAAGRDLLVLLKDNWGHWKFDAAEKEFKPDSDELEKAIAQRQLALQDAVRSQKAAAGY